MEKRKLQSMVDYVLEIEKYDPKTHSRKRGFKLIVNYAKFLSMPLTLGMFVPTDEEGNVLEEPKDFRYLKEVDLHFEKYQKALSNVIF